MNQPKRHSPHFFAREADGSVRLRIRFENEEAALFEEAAGDTPVMVWLHRTLVEAATRQVKNRRKKLGVEPPAP
jgi:hypothetical protein